MNDLERLRSDLTRAVGLSGMADRDSDYTFTHILDVIKDAGASRYIYYEHAAKLMAAYLDRQSTAAKESP